LVSTQERGIEGPAERERLTPKVILRKARTLRRMLLDLAIYLYRRQRLLLRLRLGRPVQLWVGDSHARFFIATSPMPPHPIITKESGGRYVWHGGPRILWSLAEHGLPEELLADAARIGKAKRGGELAVAVVFGEVDIRCHLAPRIGEPGFSTEFVDVYLDHLSQLGATMRADVIAAAVPVPQGRGYASHELYPIAGSIDERREAFDVVRAALHDASTHDDRPGRVRHVPILDATDDLTDEPSLLDPKLSFDGCHVTKAGAALVVARFDALRAEHAPARA
jgi:hypothetical protein